MILAVDLGTSVTKVALWDGDGMVAESGAPLETRHPAPGRAEQDAATWWGSVVAACQGVARRAPGALAGVEGVVCTGARQTFAPVDAGGAPTGPGILWSDRRAGREARELAARLGVEPGGASATGIVLDGAAVGAKIAWLAAHRPEPFDSTAWIMTPRDLVVWHLTGHAVTDVTMASRSGLYEADGSPVEGLAGPAGARLPPRLEPGEVVGTTGPEASEVTGLPPGVPVVMGAGDRACEVFGSGASEERPMVSWGTTANVSVPVADRPVPPPGIVASRAIGGSWLLEGGLSAAGSLLAWLARLTGRPPAALAAEALDSPPGARGVIATPWLDGARSPWWRPHAGAALVGVGSAHGPADVARALFESVAWDVTRCLEAMAWRRPGGPPAVELALTGSGATVPVWVAVLTGVTGLPVSSRRSGRAASAGAARLAAGALGLEWDLDRIDPVGRRTGPEPVATERYRELRRRAEAVTAALVDLEPFPGEGVACD